MKAEDYIKDVFNPALPAWWTTPNDDLKSLKPEKFFPKDFDAKPKPRPATQP